MQTKRVLPHAARTSMMVSPEISKKVGDRKPPKYTKQQWVDYLLTIALKYAHLEESTQ